MKRFPLKSGVTLIELIVAVSLISIVLLGIYATSNVLSNNSQDYGQKYLVKSETQATLDNILQNASMAIGSNASNDQGIILGTVWGDPNSFCIHQNPTGNVGADNWQCYTWFPSPNYQINSCQPAYNIALLNRGAASCVLANSTFVGTAFSISPPGTPPSFNSTIFSITIQNCLNNAAASCKNTGISLDPGNNPEFSISGSVQAPQVNNS